MSGMTSVSTRRGFLGQITLVAGGGLAAAALPASLLAATPAGLPLGHCMHSDPCGDWTLDDICNAYPPYAFHVAAGASTNVPLQLQVHPADAAWVVG